jgi:hypothetical protein
MNVFVMMITDGENGGVSMGSDEIDAEQRFDAARTSISSVA